jgi:hypothetical protein
MPRKTKPKNRDASAAASAPSSPKSPPPQNHRELAEAIFAECDPVTTGRKLLEHADERGSSVRARMFEMLADWLYGPPPGAAKSDASAGREAARPRIIWDMPRPPHEPRIPDNES